MKRLRGLCEYGSIWRLRCVVTPPADWAESLNGSAIFMISGTRAAMPS
jgi:hypothetical protein